MVDNRKSARCAIHWRCAVVVEGNGNDETIHCRTNDISLDGVSVICHRNIQPPHPVTVHLLVEQGGSGRPQLVVEVRGSIVNNVLSGQQGGFRLGIQFAKFAGEGKQLLQKHLPSVGHQPVKRVIASEPAPAKDATQTKDGNQD